MRDSAMIARLTNAGVVSGRARQPRCHRASFREFSPAERNTTKGKGGPRVDDQTAIDCTSRLRPDLIVPFSPSRDAYAHGGIRGESASEPAWTMVAEEGGLGRRLRLLSVNAEET